MSLHILHIDSQLIVLNKPSGLLSEPGRGPEKNDSLLVRVRQQHPTARIVHRLDRDTSGVIVLPLDAETHRELSRQFRERLVEKRYIAVVNGCLAEAMGQIELPLIKDFEHPPRHKVDPVLGKPALTNWRVVERGADWTRLELRPQTGRSHQLRIHLASIGHAVLGDPLYGAPETQQRASRLLLHATELTFTQPFSGALIQTESPPPF